MPKLTRRQALRGMVLGGSMAAFGGLSTLSNLVEANAENSPVSKEYPDRYYVFCYFSGGWDILVGLDPRDPAVFHNGNISTTRIQPGYELLTFDGDHPLRGPNNASGEFGQDFQFGPFIGNLMDDDLAKRLTVIRGMSMDTLTHQVGRRRFLTGRPPSGLSARGSSTDVWLASHLSKTEPIPNLSVRVESYNKEQPNYASAVRTSNSSDLLRVLAPGDVQLANMQERQLDELLAAQALCGNAMISPILKGSEESRVKVKEMLANRLDSLFDFRARTPEMDVIRDHFSVPRNATSGPEVQAAIAGLALVNGVSRCVSVEVASGLDTHFDNWVRTQGSTQRRGFNSVAALARYLNGFEYKGTGQSWLDVTTIIGFSEFSRTPMLNGQTGRDHWLGNACFALGGGVKGGQVIGKSSDFGMYPQAINLETGKLDEEGEIVRPDHILQALYHEIGLRNDEPDLRVKPLKALMKNI